MSQPPHIEQVGEAYYLNAAAILRLVSLMDPQDIQPGPKREAMIRFQGRVNAQVTAQTAQTGIKPDVWKVLEKMVDVDAIEAAMRTGRDPTEVIYSEPLLS